MSFALIATVATAIVGVALASVIVGSPYVADQIKAIGDAFTSALKAAKGK